MRYFISLIVLLVVICSFTSCAVASVATPVAATKPAATYTNPILDKDQGGGADPDVLICNDTYYYYSTNPGNHVFISKDLVHWAKGPQVLPDEFKGVWAPEVLHNKADGKFYMYYTKRYKIGVAVADRPDAMFKDLGLLVINAIDPDIFQDDDGRLYLYFANTPTFTMYCVPLKSPTETGGPITKCFQISQEWEKHSFPINEGPWMLKHDGRYYLLYSGSDGQSIYYAIGYATGPTPIGPFTKYEKNPVFQDLKNKIYGPGHGSVTRDRNGQLWHLYHQKPDEKRGWARDICLDPVSFKEDGTFGGTPTRGVVQSVPACGEDLLWSPDISPRGAVFKEPVKVTLTTRSETAEIRYTTNGIEPDKNSSRYTGPIVMTKTSTVKARAFKKGFAPSAVASAHFTQTGTGLPENPSPNGIGDPPPFEVFSTPNLNWKPPVKPVPTSQPHAETLPGK